MPAHLRRRRPLAITALALLVMLISLLPATGARAEEDIDWFGWGVKVDFERNTWKILYVTYLGSKSPAPHVVAENVVDISQQCTKGGTGTLTYPTPDSAYFDGKVYIRCELPSLRSDLAALGYTPPSGDAPFCPCVLGGAPLWVDGEVRQLNTSGTMPFMDASDRGVRVSLIVNGNQGHTKLDVLRTQPPGGSMTFTTPPWSIDRDGSRTLAGFQGKGIVAVANHFGWLKYLTDPGWQSFFSTNVTGTKIGYWNESPTMSGTANMSGNYRVGMSGGTLYIGYSPSTGTYFTGEIDEGGIDPGCLGQ